MIWPFNGQSWRNLDGEPDMTDEDWAKRGLEQANAMLHAGSAEFSSPDQDGDATYGCYEGDYPDSWHDELNQRLDTDEYFEAETEQSLWSLFRADNARREAEDSG
jgi:hypothetical protein